LNAVLVERDWSHQSNGDFGAANERFNVVLDGLGVEVMIAHRLMYDAMLPHKSLSQFCGSSG
jgi:hypothetical protein